MFAGEAKVGCIYKDELVERQLKIGDLYRIPAGSAFYLLNTGEGQRLHIICSIDKSESLGMGAFQVHEFLHRIFFYINILLYVLSG